MTKKHYITIALIILTLIITIPFFTIFSDVFPRSSVDYDYKEPPNPENKNTFDVIVYGSEPEGISAAVSAARSNLDVLLVTEDSEVGGLMTLGGLNFIDMNYDKDGTLLTRGIFEEFYKEVGGSAFEIEEAIKAFRKMLKDEGVYLKKEVTLENPILENKKITGLTVKDKKNNLKEFKGKRVIDASADAVLAAKAGVPYFMAGEDINQDDRPMGVTLIFQVENINWPKLFLHTNINRLLGELNQDYRRDWGAKLNTAWGYDDVGHAFEPEASDIVVRGLNIARQKKGRSLINCLLILDVNPLSEESRSEARKKAEKEIDKLITYFRKNIPGFEKVELVDTAEKLYTRESRYIKGEYQLNINDVLGNRDHYDRIAIGSYPIDIQPTRRWQRGVILGNPDRYSIPFRSILPLQIDNLLVVGRSAAFTSLSGGSARVIPIGMSTGEAAGIASAYSIKNQVDFRKIAETKDKINKIQKELISRGAYLEPFDREDPLKDTPAYESIKILRKLGVLYGGYDNDYNLQEPISRGRFSSLLNAILKDVNYHDKREELEIPEEKEPVSEFIFEKILAIIGQEAVSFQDSKEKLLDKNILTSKIVDDFEKNEIPNFKETSILLANFYQYLKSK